MTQNVYFLGCSSEEAHVFILPKQEKTSGCVAVKTLDSLPGVVNLEGKDSTHLQQKPSSPKNRNSSEIKLFKTRDQRALDDIISPYAEPEGRLLVHSAAWWVNKFWFCLSRFGLGFPWLTTEKAFQIPMSSRWMRKRAWLWVGRQRATASSFTPRQSSSYGKQSIKSNIGATLGIKQYKVQISLILWLFISASQSMSCCEPGVWGVYVKRSYESVFIVWFVVTSRRAVGGTITEGHVAVA